MGGAALSEKTIWVSGTQGVSLAARVLAGQMPRVVFLGGFRSDMDGTKAQYLAEWCVKRNQAFLRFDYSGHGLSGGHFEEGTISRWTADALDVIRDQAGGPCVLVGSSMGGWIMLHVALALGQQVKGLLGVAAAPDFTRDLVSQEMDDAQRDELASTGRVHLSSDYDPQGYPITETLISDGETQCLLDSPVRISAPVRLLQGFADTEVPWRTALRLSEALAAHDVRVQLLKDGDHRLSSPAQLDLLGDTLAELLETVSQD